MRLPLISVFVGVLLAGGCAGPAPRPETDSNGLVRVTSSTQGNLFAHPSRSIDDYDDILLGDVGFSYAPNQEPLSSDDELRVKSLVYEAVVRQIPAAGQLAARESGPCTVKLVVQLAALEFPRPGSRKNGATTVNLEFRDSLTGDPLVHYQQHGDLSVAPSTETGSLDLGRLGSTLEAVAANVRINFRDALPLRGTGARAGQGCKGTIGEVRKQTKLRRPG
jgi:hypothetical protein